MDWSKCPLLESDPDRVHGAWVFRGSRLPVSIVFECIARGASLGEIVEWYGGVSREQLERVVAFVAESLEPQADAHPV